jgi:hypothetical protein
LKCNDFKNGEGNQVKKFIIVFFLNQPTFNQRIS